MEDNNNTNATNSNQSEVSQGKNKNTLMGVLSYLGPLVIIPYLSAKNDPFVKFHIKQGLVLLVIEIVAYLLASFFWLIMPLMQIVNLATFILSIIGIINVVKGKETPLPLVGGYSKHFSF